MLMKIFASFLFGLMMAVAVWTTRAPVWVCGVMGIIGMLAWGWAEIRDARRSEDAKRLKKSR